MTETKIFNLDLFYQIACLTWICLAMQKPAQIRVSDSSSNPGDVKSTMTKMLYEIRCEY